MPNNHMREIVVYVVPVDKWTNFTVDEDLYREIKQGVTVYVRDAVG